MVVSDTILAYLVGTSQPVSQEGLHRRDSQQLFSITLVRVGSSDDEWRFGSWSWSHLGSDGRCEGECCAFMSVVKNDVGHDGIYTPLLKSTFLSKGVRQIYMCNFSNSFIVYEAIFLLAHRDVCLS